MQRMRMGLDFGMFSWLTANKREIWHSDHGMAIEFLGDTALRYERAGMSCAKLAEEVQVLHKCIEEHVKEGDTTSYCKDALAWP